MLSVILPKSLDRHEYSTYNQTECKYQMPALRDLYLKYRPCIVRIVVRTNAGDLSTGTGFHIGDGLVVTARHVLRERFLKPGIVGEVEAERDTTIFSITRDIDGQSLTMSRAYYHGDFRVDLAILETDFEVYGFSDPTTGRGLAKGRSVSIPIGSHVDDWISNQLVLSKVLIMGYPKIPWAESSVLVTTEAEVNALVQSVLVPHPYYIVSSMARGGFSGAPVISEAGVVIGVIVEALYGDHKPEETGFNTAITIEPLVRILVNRGARPVCVAEDIWSKFLKT